MQESRQATAAGEPPSTARDASDEALRSTGSAPLRITWVLPDANLGGGTKMVRQLAEQLQARGHRCQILYLASTRSAPPLWRPRRFGRYLLQRWRLRGTESDHLQAARVPTVALRGSRIRHDQAPDADLVIATWWETMEWIRDWPASKGRRAYYIQHHELHAGDVERVKATYRVPALQIVISRWLRDVLRDQYGSECPVLVPNGLDFEQFDAPVRGRAAVPTVGLMCSPKRWKRTELALAAIEQVRTRLPALRVVGFGDMPLSTLGDVPRGLEFTLRPPQDRIADIYRSCDAWVIASDLEGFGMPGLEAAACRCPVVATRCGGPEDYVTDGVSGRLVRPGDADALSAALLEVLQLSPDAWRAMSDASHAAARRFDWAPSVRELERAAQEYVGRPARD